MSEHTQEKAPDTGPAINLIPVWGQKKNGRPFHGVNVQNPEFPDDPNKGLLLSQGVIDLLSQATPDELVSLREKCRKARLWYTTHRAVLDESTGNVVVVARGKGPAKPARVGTGDAF